MKSQIITNKIKCKQCGDVIESRSVHDFVGCSCGNCAVDGGLNYLKRSFSTKDPTDSYEELSVFKTEGE